MARSPLSVVVVSIGRPDLLARCLEALDAERVRCGSLDVVVVRAASDHHDVSGLRTRFPACRWLTARAGETVPRMRAMAMEEACGEVIALIEDDCLVQPGWCAAILEAHRSGCAAVGGAIEPGPYARARDWAVYFYEYCRFMLPFERHASRVLPGNNVSYKRAALLRETREHDGFFDVFVHERWYRSGVAMEMSPAVVVRHCNAWPVRYLTVAPFHHGRGFAGMRVASRGRRVVLACLVPLLPLVQLLRIARHIVRRRRLVGRVMVALPWLTVFATSWAAGELVGYVSGPGESVARWR